MRTTPAPAAALLLLAPGVAPGAAPGGAVNARGVQRTRVAPHVLDDEGGTEVPPTSKRLTDDGAQHEHIVVTDDHQDPVRHRGARILVHDDGRGATVGCVSAPRRFLRTLVVRLDPAGRPVVAVGR